jgi:hypothetical protein
MELDLEEVHFAFSGCEFDVDFNGFVEDPPGRGDPTVFRYEVAFPVPCGALVLPPSFGVNSVARQSVGTSHFSFSVSFSLS